jgi:diadenosine tetraphosphate (Ap4A) HIT family hydrolase
MKDIYKFVKNFFWDEHYFSCTRESMGWRSIEHFHMHFIPWRLQWRYLRKMLENQGYPIVQELDITEKKYVK